MDMPHFIANSGFILITIFFLINSGRFGGVSYLGAGLKKLRNLTNLSLTIYPPDEDSEHLTLLGFSLKELKNLTNLSMILMFPNKRGSKCSIASKKSLYHLGNGLKELKSLTNISLYCRY